MPQIKTPAAPAHPARQQTRHAHPARMVSGRLVAVFGLFTPPGQPPIVVERPAADEPPALPDPAAKAGAAEIWRALLASRSSTLH